VGVKTLPHPCSHLTQPERRRMLAQVARNPLHEDAEFHSLAGMLPWHLSPVAWHPPSRGTRSNRPAWASAGR